MESYFLVIRNISFPDKLVKFKNETSHTKDIFNVLLKESTVQNYKSQIRAYFYTYINLKWEE
jgi:hypothetical protein